MLLIYNPPQLNKRKESCHNFSLTALDLAKELVLVQGRKDKLPNKKWFQSELIHRIYGSHE